MTLETWLAFFAASWLISLSPGPGAISCMAAGLRHGFRTAFWNIVGLILGIMFVLAIVAVGLGAILAASSTAFAVVKWLGVAYLVWLGVEQWRAPAFAVDAKAAEAALPVSPRELLLKGFLVNATNPKGIVFMLAVLPQFIDPSRPLGLQYAICGATLVVTDLVVMSGYTGFASRVLRLLREPHHIKALNRTFGGLFVAAGAALATFKRGSP
ncbi:MAG: homoserine/homoserine lactone efflux protein [Betaproteobacteria bacterium]|nr:homoserine/homoserine lactone efflux protein [Betaproteobacteria bacterium]